MTTDTFENLPRVGFEAMASGSILVVDNRGGWRLEVEDGVTGWLCNDDREFVYKASRCAFEHEERDRMRVAAREKLESTWGLQAAMDSWATVFEAWEALDRKKPAQRSLAMAAP
jgi:glycosyltransferase involved in cell wall biosynthesis